MISKKVLIYIGLGAIFISLYCLVELKMTLGLAITSGLISGIAILGLSAFITERKFYSNL